jgi:uncharacterized protein (DUF302 family)
VNDPQSHGLAEHSSPLTFGETIARLAKAIEDGGMTVFAVIDHAANARQVGMAMPPATVLIYGSPKGGTPIMLNTPLAALDLPLRVLVREAENGAVTIAFHPAAAMLEAAGVPHDTAARLEPAQLLLLKAVAP